MTGHERGIPSQSSAALGVPSDVFEPNPSTLDPAWKTVSRGIYRLEGSLLLALEVARLLDFEGAAAA